MRAKITRGYTEFIEQGGTHEGYYAQFTTESPKVGETYCINKGTWMETKLRVVFITKRFAFAEGENSAFIFYNKGASKGWRHADPRPEYRLQKI